MYNDTPLALLFKATIIGLTTMALWYMLLITFAL